MDLSWTVRNRRAGQWTGVLVSWMACCVVSAADGTVLAKEFSRFEELAGGTMGIAAIHLESGEGIFLNEDEPFPMASTFKVPVAVQLLHRVDEGELGLTDMVEVKQTDLSPGSGTLSRLFDDPGVALSVLNLMELMMLISDNSASDLCMALANGAEAVTGRMEALGIEGIRVDRSTLELIADYLGVTGLELTDRPTLGDFRERYEAIPVGQREEAGKRFALDPRDTATPRAMAELLRRIWLGTALSEGSSDLLKDVMRRCETGGGRIRGMLPAGTPVAHKTGTIGGTTNDVGVITLPQDKGHVIFVGFVKDSAREIPDREAAIAHAARSAHDYFLFKAN